jgi:hypothetical protein
MAIKQISIAFLFCILTPLSMWGQNAETSYHLVKTGVDSGKVMVKSIMTNQNGQKDTTTQLTTSNDVKAILQQKIAQRVQIEAALKQAMSEIDMLFEIIFNVKRKEEDGKNEKK